MPCLSPRSSRSLLWLRVQPHTRRLRCPPRAPLIDRHIKEVGGREAILAQTPSHATGTVSIAGRGALSGSSRRYHAKPNKFLQRMSLPGIGDMEEGFDGTVGWSLSPLTGPTLLEGKLLEQRKFDADFYEDLKAAERYESMTTLEKTTFEGRPVYKIRLVKKSGEEDIEFYDAETGLEDLGRFPTRDSPMGPIQSTTSWSDYKKFGKLLHPATTKVSAMNTQLIMVITGVEYGTVEPVRLRDSSADKGAHQVTRRRTALLGAIAIAAVLFTVPAAQTPAPADGARAIETFDAAWTIIRDSHFDPTMNGVDWPAVRAELAPRAARAQTEGELRDVIRDMLGRLGLSHFALIPSGRDNPGGPPTDLSGDPGFDVRLVGSELLVTHVDARAVPPPQGSSPAGGSFRSTTCRSPSCSPGYPTRCRIGCDTWRSGGWWRRGCADRKARGPRSCSSMGRVTSACRSSAVLNPANPRQSATCRRCTCASRPRSAGRRAARRRRDSLQRLDAGRRSPLPCGARYLPERRRHRRRSSR